MSTVETLTGDVVVQAIFEAIKGTTYLEIGLGDGGTFWQIRADRKIGVDPAPGLRVRLRLPRVVLRKGILKYLVRGPSLMRPELLFEMTSDVFYAHDAQLFTDRPIDLAFIDGLHTYKQSLCDVEHCLKYLSPQGVIVLHDCNPPSESSAVPASSFDAASQLNLPGWTGEWCGDVWKTIVRLRSSRNDIEIFVLDCDYGVGIITKGRAEQMLTYSLKEIEALDYQDLDIQRTHLLNLKTPDYLSELLARVKEIVV